MSILHMADFTDLDGVGESRAENLREAGYESVEDLTDADHEEMAENVGYLPADTALELVVQAQNIVEEEKVDGTEESEPITQQVEDALDEDAEKEIEEDEEDESVEQVDDSAETYEFSVSFDAPLEYDTFFDSVMHQRSKMLQSNRSGVDAFDHALEQMRHGSDEVTLEMTEQQLNDLHNCVRQKTVEYKGDNLIDHMEALDEVLAQINEVRTAKLF